MGRQFWIINHGERLSDDIFVGSGKLVVRDFAVVFRRHMLQMIDDKVTTVSSNHEGGVFVPWEFPGVKMRQMQRFG
jgi:hypothetical protein